MNSNVGLINKLIKCIFSYRHQYHWWLEWEGGVLVITWNLNSVARNVGDVQISCSRFCQSYLIYMTSSYMSKEMLIFVNHPVSIIATIIIIRDHPLWKVILPLVAEIQYFSGHMQLPWPGQGQQRTWVSHLYNGVYSLNYFSTFSCFEKHIAWWDYLCGMMYHNLRKIYFSNRLNSHLESWAGWLGVSGSGQLKPIVRVTRETISYPL